MSNVRYPLAVHSGAGRIAHEPSYAAHIEQLMKQVLLTTPGERINRGMEFGCGLRQMVFAPLRDVTETMTQVIVAESLERWLGDLISVDDVHVSARDESLEVRIAYAIRSRQERKYLNLEVTL